MKVVGVWRLGACFGVTHTVAMAELVKAGLCSEHGDVAVHRHIAKLEPGDQIHKVAAPQSDHGWAEWRRPGSPSGHAIVIDPWAEGPAIFAQDGRYTHSDVSEENRVSRYAYGTALGKRALKRLDEDRAQVATLDPHVKQAQRFLSASNYLPPQERLWPPEPVLSDDFADRVRRRCDDVHAMDAARAIAFDLGSSERAVDSNAERILSRATELIATPQNERRAGHEPAAGSR